MSTDIPKPLRGNGTRRPDEILAEIERTRSEMDSTLGAIEHRLTPGQLMDQGLDYLRSSGAPEFLSNLRGSVKDNPLPVTLVGVGLAWLMAADRASRREEGQAGASGAIDAGKQKLGETTRMARERLEQARRGYIRIVEEQPLALGAIGLAIGAVLAASVPRTRLEEKAAEKVSSAADKTSPAAAGNVSASPPVPAAETRPASQAVPPA